MSKLKSLWNDTKAELKSGAMSPDNLISMLLGLLLLLVSSFLFLFSIIEKNSLGVMVSLIIVIPSGLLYIKGYNKYILTKITLLALKNLRESGNFKEWEIAEQIPYATNEIKVRKIIKKQQRKGILPNINENKNDIANKNN